MCEKRAEPANTHARTRTHTHKGRAREAARVRVRKRDTCEYTRARTHARARTHTRVRKQWAAPAHASSRLSREKETVPLQRRTLSTASRTLEGREEKTTLEGREEKKTLEGREENGSGGPPP